jgi:hypothetical protein
MLWGQKTHREGPTAPIGPTGPSLSDLVRVYVNKKVLWHIDAKETRRMTEGSQGYGIEWGRTIIGDLLFDEKGRVTINSYTAPDEGYRVDFHDPNSFADFDKALRGMRGHIWRRKTRFRKACMLLWAGHYLFTDVKVIWFDACTWVYVVAMGFSFGGAFYTGKVGVWSVVSLLLGILIGLMGYKRFKAKEKIGG